MTPAAHYSIAPVIRRSAGFSLVELMVAMLISLLLGAAAVSLFLSNSRVYGTTEGVGRLQENVRMAFELMARDIREAGGNPCDSRMKIVNVLSDTANWWAAYDTGIRGFTEETGFPADAPANRVAGNDAIRVQYFEDTGVVTSAGMGSDTGALSVASTDPFEPHQILMACGFFPVTPSTPVIDAASIFSAGIAAGQLTHETTSGNQRNTFSDATQLVPVVYPEGTLIGRLRALQWYLGSNADGTTSLYRQQLLNSLDGAGPVLGVEEEVVPGVTSLRFYYLEDDDWTDLGDLPADWSNVTAVRVDMELESGDGTVTGPSSTIRRKLTHVIALRNKL